VSQLAPIVLFVFNRPEHTRKTLESLRRNVLAPESELYVFCDGPRDRKDEREVEAVQSLVDSLEGFKQVHVSKRERNRGLAGSVIDGVTEVIGRHGTVIVVEDDLQFSPRFLNFMNDALARYADDPRVFSLGGYSPPLAIPKHYTEECYLSYRCCTWGWGTWRDRWDKVDWEVRDFDAFINDPEEVARFNRGGDDMSQILKLQIDNKISSWGIRWDYAHYRHNAYCFRPTYSIVGNIGNDGTGVHCAPTDKFDVAINEQSSFNLTEPDKLALNEELNNRFATFYDGRPRGAVEPVAVVSAKSSLGSRLGRKLRSLAGRLARGR